MSESFWSLYGKRPDDIWPLEKIERELTVSHLGPQLQAYVDRIAEVSGQEAVKTALKIGTYLGRRRLFKSSRFVVSANSIQVSTRILNDLQICTFPCIRWRYVKKWEKEAGVASTYLPWIDQSDDNYVAWLALVPFTRYFGLKSRRLVYHHDDKAVYAV